MKETLEAAGGSVQEKEKWLLAMLAQLRAISPELAEGAGGDVA